jgi:lipoprotein NlpI
MTRLLSIGAIILCTFWILAQTEQTMDQLISRNRVALKNEDFKTALKAADELVEKFPKKAIPLFVRGETHELSGDPKAAIADLTAGIALDPKIARAYDVRGGAYFKLGQVKVSLSDFDKQIELAPTSKENHWRRGISLYYLRKYAEGAEQFALGRRVYKDDVENAFWHWLCLARSEGVEAAKKSLLPIGRDQRPPMMTVLEVLHGKAMPEDILKECEKLKDNPAEYSIAKFYGHLYLGLYYEGIGKNDKVQENLELAAGKYLDKQYMGDVAKVHLQLLKEKK